MDLLPVETNTKSTEVPDSAIEVLKAIRAAEERGLLKTLFILRTKGGRSVLEQVDVVDLIRIFVLVLITLIALPGCTGGVRDELRENMSEASDIVASPRYREFHYRRDGATLHYYRLECEGELCPEELSQ